VQVTDPSGRTWQVERRLIQLPRWRGFGEPVDGSDAVLGTSDDLTGLLIAVGFAIALLIATVVVWPLLLFLAELLAAALLVGARLLLGRWTVVAETQDERKSWRIRGHGESKRFATQVVELLRSGSALPAPAD
jgi:hypothetical protein